LPGGKEFAGSLPTGEKRRRKKKGNCVIPKGVKKVIVIFTGGAGRKFPGIRYW